MKAITVLILLSLLSFQVEAKSGVSLSEAVNQVKSEGRVLSAKTVNGRHEIKILTHNGTVKTINKKAGRVNSNRNSNLNRPQTLHNKYRSSSRPSRLKSSRNVMQLKQQKAQSRRSTDNKGNSKSRRNVQRTPSRNKKTTKSKNKDN